MISTGPRRIAVMGAPGAGKSALIAALGKRGWKTVAEAARMILQAPGGMELRDKDPIGFALAMLERDQAAFAAAEDGDIVIFDRGFCDIIAFLRVQNLAVPPQVDSACREQRFDAPVFHASAWRAIYKQDAERVQTWEQAVESDDENQRAWRDYGYDLLALPFSDVDQRAEFVEDLVKR